MQNINDAKRYALLFKILLSPRVRQKLMPHMLNVQTRQLRDKYKYPTLDLSGQSITGLVLRDLWSCLRHA